ncbi:PQQ-dependent sugar dehydrogenase [Olivibacter sp. SDN3]|uniref:PQQ-dependent sugar dehydrogenase n=1 Tax=Olivibacter sp. SDN3 TaxID=2764720 RepID=UPI00165125A3|nr:PQQ-dependent sugar dehydrogenase [Olivibacter sp. SDN3]QNL49290.1 PQQ-dependent sugar dehydrogenase [Olivibacter sp. SDN3]
MKKAIVTLGILGTLLVIWIYSGSEQNTFNSSKYLYLLDSTILRIDTIAKGLCVPWEIALDTDGHLWFTEQFGRISRLDLKSGEQKVMLELTDVFQERTSGLLGMTLHPDFAKKPYVFITYTARKTSKRNVSRVVRYTYEEDSLLYPLVFLEYPAWKAHFGARVIISPEDEVIVATGDGAQNGNAQSVLSVNGKILRYHIDGSIPVDNPLPNNPVWAWGLRNPQGLTYTENNKLFSSDHGDATDDEVNRIEKGKNYGWPTIEGYVDSEQEKHFARDTPVVSPLIAWTPTVAPAGLAYYNYATIPEWKNSLLLATLKGNSIRVLQLNPNQDKITVDYPIFQQVFGRIRAICTSPEGEVYFSTSNKDWNPNGIAEEADDKIIRISKLNRKTNNKDSILHAKAVVQNTSLSNGETLYTNYCLSCHKPDGRGIPAIYPSLVENTIVENNQTKFIKLVLEGNKEMPNFSFLEDEELAAILTYVRRKFTSQQTGISSQQVKQHRKDYK